MTTQCPTCCHPEAEIVDRYLADSTDGITECVRLLCRNGCIYNGDVKSLDGFRKVAERRLRL